MSLDVYSMNADPVPINEFGGRRHGWEHRDRARLDRICGGRSLPRGMHHKSRRALHVGDEDVSLTEEDGSLQGRQYGAGSEHRTFVMLNCVPHLISQRPSLFLFLSLKAIDSVTLGQSFGGNEQRR